MSNADHWGLDWTDVSPPPMGIGVLHPTEGFWEGGSWEGLKCRDFGVREASNGRLGACHLKVDGHGDVSADWHALNADFHSIYVLSGTLRLELDDGSRLELGAHDHVLVPALYRHRWKATSGLEMFEITVPARPEVVHGRDGRLPKRVQELESSRKPVISLEKPENYEVGDGPRSFLAYRDLMVDGPSGGRVHLHVVRVDSPDDRPDVSTGWHSHSMSQVAIILEGSAVLELGDGEGARTISSGTCSFMGPRTAHDVHDISSDYAVLEMCMPVEYDTVEETPTGVT